MSELFIPHRIYHCMQPARGISWTIDMLLENGGVDNWRNPYDDVSCLQVVDNVVSVSVMESTCVEVCYISESDPILMGQIS